MRSSPTKTKLGLEFKKVSNPGRRKRLLRTANEKTFLVRNLHPAPLRWSFMHGGRTCSKARLSSKGRALVTMMLLTAENLLIDLKLRSKIGYQSCLSRTPTVSQIATELVVKQLTVSKDYSRASTRLSVTCRLASISNNTYRQ